MLRYRLVLAIASIVVGADQLSKRWAQAALPGNPVELIPGWLSLEYAENPGAAFGLFVDAGPVLAVVGVGIVGIVLGMVRSADTRRELIALGVVLGGAAGNLIDRFSRGEGLLDGKVIDFIRLWAIPNFNVADAAINIGILLMFILALPGSRRA